MVALPVIMIYRDELEIRVCDILKKIICSSARGSEMCYLLLLLLLFFYNWNAVIFNSAACIVMQHIYSWCFLHFFLFDH